MIMKENNTQNAGDCSNQYQADAINVTNINVNGITEERARAICDESFDKVKQEFTHEAIEIAEGRVAELENNLMKKMSHVEEYMNAFKDPSFQLLLADAQKTAAATERTVDYEMLSELLIHRINKGGDRKSRLGIKKAVEIVDQISDEALLGLTVAFAAKQYVPVSGQIMEGLGTLDSLYNKLIYDTLPLGREWIEHLDLLNTVRISPTDKFMDYCEYKSKGLPGYVALGIKKDSEQYIKATDLLKSVNFPESVLIDHELFDGYVRIPIVTIDGIEKLSIIKHTGANKTYEEISDNQKIVLKQIWDMYEDDDGNKGRKLLSEKMSSFPNISKVCIWWNQLPTFFSVTAAGKVLAHANAKRCDNKIPDLD